MVKMLGFRNGIVRYRLPISVIGFWWLSEIRHLICDVLGLWSKSAFI